MFWPCFEIRVRVWFFLTLTLTLARPRTTTTTTTTTNDQRAAPPLSVMHPANIGETSNREWRGTERRVRRGLH